MGKSITPKYRLEVWDQAGKWQTGWKGRANSKHLLWWLDNYIESLKPGGVNAHLSRAYGYMPVPHRARIVEQKTGDIKVDWEAPAFMALNPGYGSVNWAESFVTDDGREAVLIGFWQDLYGYYQVGDEVHKYKHRTSQWTNEGDAKEFKRRLAGGKIRGILL